MLGVLDDFLWTLRREGFDIATSQAIDVARAAREVGLDDRCSLREAIACVVVDVASRARFDQLFERFFSPRDPPRRSMAGACCAQGFAVPSSRRCASCSAIWRRRRATRLARALRGRHRSSTASSPASGPKLLGRMNDPLQAGFFAHRVLDGSRARRAPGARCLERAAHGRRSAPTRAEELVRR